MGSAFPGERCTNSDRYPLFEDRRDHSFISFFGIISQIKDDPVSKKLRLSFLSYGRRTTRGDGQKNIFSFPNSPSKFSG
ncbi:MULTISPECIES: hypothetical protein [Nostocaceae]|uniref:hypothetical protein n=1 Tax=Nostocaceae TaxID=1162 RepID=UPI0012938215|nr:MULTISPECIES: hypothetical protein [Nostocaceae]MBD2380227.1 hypothetical protein [Trichormus variabilis FACHB-319]QFZ12104.1 hypothetical protein EH233_08765 [Anabaena sp. YBS01]